MLFSELMEAELPEELTGEVNRLLELKMNSPEVKLIPRISVINDYLDKSITDIKSMVKSMDDSTTPDWDELNEMFLQEVQLNSFEW